MTQSIVPGSLSAITARDGGSLAETFIGVDAIIIVDVSGSMLTNDSRGGKSRLEVAREELAQLQAHMPGKLAVIAFSDHAMFCPGGEPPDVGILGGGTDLAGALRFAKVADVPGIRFVVISDGCPDSESVALSVAKTYANRIDTIFVGPEADIEGGRRFLSRLAAASGGQHVTANRVKELAVTTERLLLLGA
jgi:Mg-chelatase subunit ChlD